ncbi:MAG TPA: hypothetical protein PK440_17580 [Candidatus Accumulibacter phosphatis]|nr:hypothetical protein [Candidatus Accumulibacter phosphatis]
MHTYNPRTDGFYIGDPVIRDVCADCNNEKLSPLDAYLSELYDRNFAKVIEPGESVQLAYSYERLLRAILKISYNSTRASGNSQSIAAHQRFVRYVLNGGHCGKLALRLQIVTSAKVINLAGGSDSALMPAALRCAVLNYEGVLSHRFVVRLIGINSFWFYLVLSFKEEPDHKWRDFLQGFMAWATPSGVAIQPGSKSIEIPVEKTTYMHPRLLGHLLRAGSA